MLSYAFGGLANKCTEMSVTTMEQIKQKNELNFNDRWLHSGSDGCTIRNISSYNAKQCMAGRKFAFFGDSMTRDMGNALIEFLVLGTDLFKMNNTNFSPIDVWDFAPPFTKKCVCQGRAVIEEGVTEAIKCYNNNRHGCAYAHVYRGSRGKLSWEIWLFLRGGFGTNTFKTITTLQQLVNFDLIFLGNHGFHGIESRVPHQYPDIFLKPLLGWDNPVRAHSAKLNKHERNLRPGDGPHRVPFLYLTINQNYDDKKLPEFGNLHQEHLADYVNDITMDFVLAQNIPYFDMDLLSRHRNASADGVHIMQWANLINIKMLLHFICDESWHFRQAFFHTPS